MVITERVDKADAPSLIAIAFAGDDELHKYHLEPGTFEEMCESNYGRIMTYEDMPGELEYYKIIEGDNVIGYMVIYDESPKVKFLISFGVNILYRSKEILMDWVNGVKEVFGDAMIPLADKNYRAIKFFVRNGYKIVGEQQNVVYLWPYH